MKTTRRRAASPVISWKSTEADHEYRVIVRNQDTGERQAIYEGALTECRLPPELSTTPDLLAFRVMARPIGDTEEPFAQIMEFRPIPRLGDDYDTPAADLLTLEPPPGASQYRLSVRSPGTGKLLVDLIRDEPRFLLPAGQLRDGEHRCDLKARIDGRWRTATSLATTPEMIAAADARAENPVVAPRTELPQVKGRVARTAPGRAEMLAAERLASGPRLLIVIDVTAAPDAAPVADAADVVRRQWWSGDGSGAVESVVLALEAHGLRGQFQLDVLAGDALGDEAVSSLATTLESRGHGLGLLVNTERWRGLSPETPEMRPGVAFEYAVERYEAITGKRPQVVSFGKEILGPPLLGHIRRLGVQAVFADRAEQKRLPAWMRWRTAPFAAYDDLVVIPSSMLLSTPAHERDQPVRHLLSAADAMAAASAEAIVSAMTRTGDQDLVVARIDPMGLLRRRMVRSADQAEAWNLALADSLPLWAEAGWERNPEGFAVLDERDEIKTEMMTSLLASLAQSDLDLADLSTVFSPPALRAWSEETHAFDPMIEQRRGPRLLRRSGVRRYDEAYLQALGAPPA